MIRIAVLFALLVVLSVGACDSGEKTVEEFLPLPRDKAVKYKPKDLLQEDSCDDPEHYKKIKQAAALNEEGLKLLKDGKLAEAAKRFEQALQMIPVFADARFNLGLCKMRMKDYDGALAVFNKVIADVPDWPDAYVNAGIVLLNLGRGDEAVKMLEKAIKLDPTDPNIWLNLGIVYINTAQQKKGLAVLKEAAKRFPKNKEIWFAFIRELINQHRSLDVEAEFKKAEARFGDDFEIPLLEAKFFIDTNRIEDAMSALDRAKRLGAPEDRRAFLEGIVLESAKKYADALEKYKIVETREPKNAVLLMRMGRILLLLGKYEDALKYLQRATSVGNEAQAWMYLGVAYQRLGRTQQAIAAYERFMSLTRNSKLHQKDREEVQTTINLLKKGENAGLPGMPH